MCFILRAAESTCDARVRKVVEAFVDDLELLGSVVVVPSLDAVL